MDGWTDGGMVGWKEWNIIFCRTDSVAVSLSLMGALINYAPALNGNAGERNTAEANSYHDFCSN